MFHWKKVMAAGLALTLGASLLIGCGSKETAADDDDDWVVVGDNDDERMEPETERSTESSSEETNSVFIEMSEYHYTFASGAGAWSTELDVNKDGSFVGSYSDADMGDTGTDYPNGLVYVCEFSGQFTTPEKVDDYTYKTTIADIKYEDKVGKEEIKDGVKYIYSGAYGLDDAKDIYIYVKGTPVSQLPKEYFDWVSMALEDGQTELSAYGIYNEGGQEGFYGWKSDGADVSDSSSDEEELSGIDAELAQLEERAQKMQEQLQSGDMTQGDMNELSAKLYKLWDDELNSIWKRLDEDAKAELLDEEGAWIKEKESKIEEAGKDWEGGSGQPLAENTEGADLTRARVYELAEYLR